MIKDELLEKVKVKTRERLGNWENLTKEEQGETAEMIVMASFVENSEKLAQGLINIAISVKRGFCVECNSYLGFGMDCELCGTMRRGVTRSKTSINKHKKRLT